MIFSKIDRGQPLRTLKPGGVVTEDWACQGSSLRIIVSINLA